VYSEEDPADYEDIITEWKRALRRTQRPLRQKRTPRRKRIAYTYLVIVSSKIPTFGNLIPVFSCISDVNYKCAFLGRPTFFPRSALRGIVCVPG